MGRVGQEGRACPPKREARRRDGQEGRTAPSAARQVEGFIAKFDPEIAAIARKARAAMRKRFPAAVELVYDNYNALAMGFSTTEKASDAIVSVAVYARGVNLYFIYGRSLPDPHRLLQGGGNQGAFIRLESADVLADPRVEDLLVAAEEDAETPFPTRGRGYTIVRSVSKKQRPRRTGRHS